MKSSSFLFRSVGYLLTLIFLVAGLGVPLTYLCKEAFLNNGSVSFESFELLFHDDLLLESLINSLFIGTVTSALSVLLGGCVALVLGTRRIPGEGILATLLLAPLFLPPLVGVVGMKAILSRSGVINMTLLKLHLIDSPMDLLSPHYASGIILVQALHFFPLVYLQVSAALSRCNAELLEGAFTVGASKAKAMYSVLLPLISSSIISSALLVFVGSFTDIGTPLIFEYRNTVSVRVFNMITDTANSQAGYALVVIIALVSLLLFLAARYYESLGKFSETTRSFRPIKKSEIGGSVSVVMAVLFFTLGIISVLPHLGVLLESISQRWFMTPLPERLTSHHFYEVFTHPLTSRSLLYSLCLSTASTVLVFVVAFIIAWGTIRRGKFMDVLLEQLSMLPLTFPGIVIAFGLMLGFSGTILDNRKDPTMLLILAYATRKLPLMVRVLASALQQANASFEEAARMFGANLFQTIRRITLPLMKQAIVSGVILCFLGNLLEVSDSLILALEERYYPITKAIYALQGRPDGTPIASALGVVVMVIVVGGFFLAARISGKKIGALVAQ